MLSITALGAPLNRNVKLHGNIVSDKTSLLRAEVIEKAINIEWIIHSVICQHYFGKVLLGFVSEFLYDEYCSFALKRRVLLKIAPELSGEFANRLGRLNTIRNYFAHIGQVIIDGPSLDSPTRVPDPRNFSKSVDFLALHQEFLALEPDITKQLGEIYRKKGGTWVQSAT